MKLRPIAIYLPQFHPIKENDEWWGKGFTEWSNVTKATPLFKGHYQPHLPADLGYYDLRLPEVRKAQAAMAKEYGIFGFCYYHYWFNGERLLERPFNEVLQSGEPDFPFMLCWANENWTRTWDGGENVILKKQEYTANDAYAHINALIPAFKDPRYIRVNGKPVFAFYRSTIIPNIEEYVKIFRHEAAKHDIDLYLCRFETFGKYGKEYMQPGFDAAIDFQPFAQSFFNYNNEVLMPAYKKKAITRLANKALQTLGSKELHEQRIRNLTNRVDYNNYVDYLIGHYNYPADYKRFPGVTPSWDNTARKGKRAHIFTNANPQKYEQWLHFHKQHFLPPSKDENFIFINAWNEWAEGNHLEPCQKWGRQYLEATKNSLK